VRTHDGVLHNDESSTPIPEVPIHLERKRRGQAKQLVQTIPDKGWNTLLRSTARLSRGSTRLGGLERLSRCNLPIANAGNPAIVTIDVVAPDQ
jgi:hypothetical protein